MNVPAEVMGWVEALGWSLVHFVWQGLVIGAAFALVRALLPRENSAARYASGLRKVVRTHEPHKLVDTLVVGAFIEARSCERFEALVPHLDEELGKFYFGLLKSEARHFQNYLKLAYQYGDARDVDQAIERVRAAERELIESPDTEFRFHSGVPPR